MLSTHFKLVSLILLFMTVSTRMDAQAQSSISFDVSFSEPQAHYADVKMTVKGVERDYIDLKMPVWTPGSYLVREYARHVESAAAVDGEGRALEVRKINKNTWRVFSGNRSEIQFSYRLYGFEVSVRTNYIDDSHAFLSPAGTFLFVDGMLDHPATVTIHPHANWSKVSTGLDLVEERSLPTTHPTSIFYLIHRSRWAIRMCSPLKPAESCMKWLWWVGEITIRND